MSNSYDKLKAQKEAKDTLQPDGWGASSIWQRALARCQSIGITVDNPNFASVFEIARDEILDEQEGEQADTETNWYQRLSEAVSAEREACAAIADDCGHKEDAGLIIADWIRSRGDARQNSTAWLIYGNGEASPRGSIGAWQRQFLSRLRATR